MRVVKSEEMNDSLVETPFLLKVLWSREEAIQIPEYACSKMRNAVCPVEIPGLLEILWFCDMVITTCRNTQVT